MQNPDAPDVIILGAGAAGLMAARVAGLRGRRVLVIDHARAPGAKILISGGGRCNFTNTGTVPDRFLSANPHFAKSALGRYKPADFIALVDSYDIAWHEKTLGQLFCDGSARQIVAMMVEECARAGNQGGDVEIACGESIRDVRHVDGHFHVAFGTRLASAPALVIATGGPSIPQMGSTSFAYDLARQFGLKIVQPRPALVPLTLSNDETLFRELSGVATPVVARVTNGPWGKAAFREAALFTHKGLSGPAILQISSYWNKGDAIGIDFLPDSPPGLLTAAKKASPRSGVLRHLPLPERLGQVLVETLGLSGELATMTDKALNAAEANLRYWRFTPSGSEGFLKAEVTAGGISTAELSSKTMEATKVPGLYAIGEAVDVTGWLGGYNFQWAWASGSAAGQVV